MNLTKKESAEAVKKLALNAGFDAVGIAGPDALEQGDRMMESWVAQGRHGSMAFLENFRARRERMLREFGQVRSVIVLGVNYYRPESRREGAEPLSGQVARYARGRDYHDLIRGRHGVLIAGLRDLLGPDLKAKSCVDTESVPERLTANVAGLGFAGKHTAILNKRFGPWLFLSEILTDVDLDTDAPASGDCGACALCKEACPTGALDEDYTMDARRCIAYLTIEHKGIIPRQLRPLIGDRIFGCDKCLSVCPFVREVPASGWKELSPEAGTGERIDAAGLFGLASNSACEKKFEGTAAARLNRKQWLRNACVVLGNSESPQALVFLEKGLKDSSPLVRLHAAWALGRLGLEEGKGMLLAQRAGEKDPEVLEEIGWALDRFCTDSGDLDVKGAVPL